VDEALEGEEGEEEADDTVVDPRDLLKLLLAGGEEQRDALLERYGGRGKVEKDIVREIADTTVIADVAGFENEHRLAMHAIEVLSRNGARPPRLPKLAIVKPIAAGVIGLVLGFIVRGYRNQLSRDIRRTYERRCAMAASGSVERALLLRATTTSLSSTTASPGAARACPPSWSEAPCCRPCSPPSSRG
jgi:hypothetical protein